MWVGNSQRPDSARKRQLEEARECYDSWAKSALVKQTLAMRAITGIVR